MQETSSVLSGVAARTDLSRAKVSAPLSRIGGPYIAVHAAGMAMNAGIQGPGQGRHGLEPSDVWHRASRWPRVAVSVPRIKHLWSVNNGLGLEGRGGFYFQIRYGANKTVLKVYCQPTS